MMPRLDRARWAVLSPLLDEALEMTAAGREAWLRDVEKRDPALAAELEALLSEYGKVEEEGFLVEAPAPRSTLNGQVLGAYRLRQQIGRGGMGSVWLAERADGRFEGVAAVKLLNLSLIGHEAEQRFRREGSILARLRHPHIARLIDAGVSPAGQPYLVLEHVDGEPLDVYCDRRRLGVEARVRLFLDVMAAVAHAHANLVVHRDLKPSNVLVDGEGTVKLLDFGVAKLLAADGDGTPATVTRDGSSALTPEYAAPEQLAGTDVTTATDVFALGVLLYELLSGRHPLGRAARESPGELVRAILDVEPARLPAVAIEDGGGEDARQCAEERGTTPPALSRALKGDLETIVAKALKKDPEERYASAVAFADDLRRWLEHAPIRARPDTFAYRAAKFGRRHRVPVALAAVMLASLGAGLAGTVWQARAAARERDLALAQLERADRLHSFTVFLLGKAFPGGEPVRIRDILDRGERLAQSQVEQDPALAVEMLIGIGGLYVVREDVAAGERVLRRAYDLSQRVADPTTRAGATCVWARVVALKGDTPAALRLVDAGLALTSEEARFDEVVSQCLVDRGSIAMNAGSADVVARASEEALRRLGRRPHAFPEARFSALHLNAVSRRMAGDTAEADRRFAQALDQLRRLGRDESTDAAVLLHNWALNTSLTNPRAAADQNRRVITLFEGARGEGQPDSVPVPALLNYAVNLNRLSDHVQARAMAERTREVAERQGNRQAASGAGMELATACLRLGTDACARESLRRAATDVAAAYPAGHRVQGDLLRAQALLASREGSDEEALRLLQAAQAIHGKLESPHPTQIETALELSRLELRLGRPQEAEAQARAALAIAEKFQGGTPHSAWVGRGQLALSAARQAQGDAAGARALLASAAGHMAPTLGPSHPALLEARQLAAR